MHIDHRPYFKFTSRRRLEQSINSLLGVVEGIAIDRKITASELGFLTLWLESHADVRSSHPYTELMPVVEGALTDGLLTQDEHDDIVWLCERLRSTDFYDIATADIQRLHAVLGGIAADGAVTEPELRGLASWLETHDHLRTCWPYDEVDSVVLGVLRDKRIDEQEHALLKAMFTEFVALLDSRTIVSPVVMESGSIVGLCAVCPEITFKDETFCFTGASMRYTRTSFATLIQDLGGLVSSSVTRKVRYLVIGGDGNPCWTYACYGRKVERAVQLRRGGARLVIVHENDLHDAVVDA